jgi:hypothetical protein
LLDLFGFIERENDLKTTKFHVAAQVLRPQLSCIACLSCTWTYQEGPVLVLVGYGAITTLLVGSEYVYKGEKVELTSFNAVKIENHWQEENAEPQSIRVQWRRTIGRTIKGGKKGAARTMAETVERTP